MALVAMSCFKPSFSLAQINSPQPPATGTSSQMPNYKIKTPNTKDQLKEDKSAVSSKVDETDDSSSSENDYSAGPAPRRLQQHGIGLGLGETFLLGNYGKHGADKITLDLLYSYAASHSFDLLIDAHMSEHKDNSERVKVMGISSSDM